MANNIDAVLEGLNEEQKKAVQCIEGPVLIVAGAGSGKTRVLTSRIAYILAEGCEPSRILALTFTKKAAGEMKDRIAGMVGAQSARRLVMGTFHSVFIRFLRQYASFLGYPEQFTIYDQSDSTSAVKACIKELGLDDKTYKPRDVLSRISMAKNNLITVSAYRSNQNVLIADAHAKRPRICDIYERYQLKMKQSGVMDFDDILVNMNVLLKQNPEALKEIASRFSYIMVDEYQDTNFSQYLIVKKLSQLHRNVCVVGDDSQSIYAFRGAKIENILGFKKDYPEMKTFRLERNYRSTSIIVDAANSLIEHNAGRIPKKCYSVGAEGEKIKVLKTYSETGEAEAIVDEIKARMRSAHAQYQDFAILYRTNSQSRAIEDKLRRWNVPYIVYSGNSFFERAEVKDMMAYFKLVVNPLDDESFKRVVNKPVRGIGDTSMGILESAAQSAGLTLMETCALDNLEQFGLRTAAILKIRSFCKLITGLSVLVKSTDAFVLAQKIADDSGLYAFYKSDTSIEGQSRTSNVEELISSVLDFVEERLDEAEDDYVVTLDDFLENVSLLSNADTKDDEDSSNKVALMTVHAAKGLEFPYVFVTGLEENLFPSLSMTSAQNDIEEERRLFYVAITRAQKAVALSFAATRNRNGNHESNAPSRFIKEIDSRYLDNPLEEEDFSNAGVTHEWGGFGSRFTGGRLDRFKTESSVPRYGQSSEVRFEKRTFTSEAFSRRLQSASSAAAPSKPPVIDPNFKEVPMTELFVGERIEHNRFGGGKILEITGRFPDMKARIFFDDYGEKLLLLKYAKLRPEK